MFKMDAFGKLTSKHDRVPLPDIYRNREIARESYYSSVQSNYGFNDENVVVDKHPHINLSDESFTKDEDSSSASKESFSESTYDLPPTNDSSKSSVQQRQL